MKVGLTILAFDQSVTNTGWAVIYAPPGKVIASGSFTSNPRDEDPTDDQKLDAFGDQIFALRARWKPHVIAWERAKQTITRYAKGGGSTVNRSQLLLPELQGMLRALARGKHLPYIAAYFSSWRAGVLGKGAGNLPKEKAKARAVAHCKLIGVPIGSHDEAEAVCIGLYAASTDEFRWLVYEAEKKAAAAAAKEEAAA